MFISRQSKTGGRKIEYFPLLCDTKTSRLGFKLGWCEGCNEAIFITLGDTQDVLSRLGPVDNHIPFKHKIAEWLTKE